MDATGEGASLTLNSVQDGSDNPSTVNREPSNLTFENLFERGLIKSEKGGDQCVINENMKSCSRKSFW